MTKTKLPTSIRPLRLDAESIRPLAPSELPAVIGGSYGTCNCIWKPGH
jgi:hypothetical protein